MSIRLVNPTLRWGIFGFTLLVFLGVSYTVGLVWYADVLANSPNFNGLKDATQIEPGNGDYWYRLGINQQLNLENSNTGQAIGYLRKATEISPRSADYWMGLADAYESAGQLDQARDAFQRAVGVYPVSSDAHWRYGSFLIRQGETPQGYKEIHVALGITPQLTPLAISRVWRATENVNDLLTKVLPDDLDAQRQALDFFCSQNEIEPATVVWDHIVASGRRIPIKTIFPLINQLLSAARGDDARRVWRQAVVASGNQDEVTQGDSLVFNGGFEYDIANGGLDWHLDAVPGVTYGYEMASQHSGKRALRIGFDGTQNFNFNGLWQDIPVEPNTKYHFEGYLRTGGITTDSGPRFLIGFAGGRQPDILLSDFTGDRRWEVQTADFTTASDVYLLRIYVSRLPSKRFDNKMAGFVWIDDVSLLPTGGHPNP
jgi:tetratricopeptide (TPR) repeat protein